MSSGVLSIDEKWIPREKGKKNNSLRTLDLEDKISLPMVDVLHITVVNRKDANLL